MKRQHVVIIFCFLWFATFTTVKECHARDVIRGQITDAIRERIALSAGDKVTISVGKNHGLIKGDIGKIASSKNDGRIEIGRCVIEESNRDNSVCLIIESFRETGRGDLVLFDGVSYRDKALFLPIIDLLDSSVKAYPTHEKVRMLFHEVFDAKNNITQLSEKVRGELIYIASQKKRIVLMTTRDMPDFSYYPNEYNASAQQMKDLLRKRNLDLLLTGTCATDGTTTELSFQRLCREGDDRVIVFPIPTGDLYDQRPDKVILPYVKREKRPDSVCSITYKPRHYVPLKEEKNAIIRDESGGDPFKELNLKRVEFNIISPIEFKVTVDGTMVNITENGAGRISLSGGPHRVHASFKRGYYSNESLLYVSGKELSRDALLELSKDQEVIVEILVDAMPDKTDPISFKVYRKTEKEKGVLRPIQKFESERMIETFVD